MDISGDGTVIAFSSAESPQARWYSIHSDGSSKIAVENAGFDVGGVSLTYDGTKMFYSDALAYGGRLVNTDGSGGIDLFPKSNVATIVLSATRDPYISDDGSRVSFRFGYSSWLFKEALYIGYINDPGAVPDAPVISSKTVVLADTVLPIGGVPIHTETREILKLNLRITQQIRRQHGSNSSNFKRH